MDKSKSPIIKTINIDTNADKKNNKTTRKKKVIVATLETLATLEINTDNTDNTNNTDNTDNINNTNDTDDANDTMLKQIELQAQLKDIMKQYIDIPQVSTIDNTITEPEKVKQSDKNTYDYYTHTFDVIDTILQQHNNRELINHQHESYKQFINKDLGDIIRQFNTRKLYFDYDANANKHKLELHIDFLNYNLGRPTIHENDGSFKIMRPDIARLRNLSYSSPLTINVKLTSIVRTSSYYNNNIYGNSNNNSNNNNNNTSSIR